MDQPARWRVAGFTELRELGAGAQGRVVLARHDTSGMVVAVKYVFGTGDLTRFREEARLLRRVANPYVAKLYDYVEEPGKGAAILMEAVDGVSLRVALDRHGTLTPEASLAVLKGSLLGLAAAHELGVVHRDYKPANVVVEDDGLSKLIDFGVATLTGRQDRSGTPAYMAPEQWRAEPATPSTDVYAATCVFFECVTGHRPYTADDQVALMGLHLTEPVPVADVPEPLRELVARGMAKTAGERPPSAAAFVTELETVAGAAYGPDWETRGWRALGAAAAALAALSPLAGLLIGAGQAAGHAAAQAGHAAAQAAGQAAAGHGVGSAVGHGAVATGRRVFYKTVLGKAVIGGTAAVVAAGGAAAVVVAAQPAAKPVAGPPPRPPTLAYATATAVQIRSGTGAARTLAAVPAGMRVGNLVWSADGTRLGWIAERYPKSTIYLADVRGGGRVRSWDCTCDSAAFQGDRLVTGGGLTGGPHLLYYSAASARPVSTRVTGLPPLGPVTNTFNLHTVTASGALIVGYGTGVSAAGGPQTLYQVDTAGHATRFGSPRDPTTDNTVPWNFTTSPDGRRIGYLISSHGGYCANTDSVVLLDAATGRASRPAMPARGYTGSVWFDPAGTAYTAFVPQPAGCRSTSATGAGQVAETAVTPQVYRAEGGRWVRTADHVLQQLYGRAGWRATLNGTMTSGALGGGRPAGALVVTHGTVSTPLAQGVSAIAWAPRG
ncbi:serine/threonine-protein kinase [Actinomadura scrupuli]|uniref:serine/threonine-protein kinase n=1 Tax=Actinomadura scrupuli TaxID=559629 RepID=UPI003D97C446